MSIPLLKNRGRSLGRKTGERGIDRIGRWSEPRSCSTSKEQEKRAEKEMSGGATARGAMEKDGCVRVIEGEEVRGDDQSNTSSPRGSEVTLECQRG